MESNKSSSDNEELEESKKKNITAHGCFYNFSNELFKLSVISYFFINGICYMIGSIIILIGYNNVALKIQGKIACPGTTNIYLLSVLWFTFGIISLITCIGYSSSIEENNIIYENALYVYILGIFCKTIPSIVRILHIFNLFQLYLITLDFLFLPECNSYYMRSILFIMHIFWWIIVIFGIISRKKIFLPPHLYNPLNNETGFIVYINNYVHSFGL